MSLNGLEAAEVNDAYQFALAEGGGWFVISKRPRGKRENKDLRADGSSGFYSNI